VQCLEYFGVFNKQSCYRTTALRIIARHCYKLCRKLCVAPSYSKHLLHKYNFTTSYPDRQNYLYVRHSGNHLSKPTILISNTRDYTFLMTVMLANKLPSVDKILCITNLNKYLYYCNSANYIRTYTSTELGI
jgi:hypothetical protein